MAGTSTGGEGRIGEAATSASAGGRGARGAFRSRRPQRRARARARGAALFVLAVAVFFSASAFLDGGPRQGDGGRGAEDSREEVVPPRMRCGAGNLCDDEGGGAQGEAASPSAAGPEGGHDGR